jgi:hypothetical protein
VTAAEKVNAVLRAEVEIHADYRLIVLPPGVIEATFARQGSPWSVRPLTDNRVVLGITYNALAEILISVLDAKAQGHGVSDFNEALLRRLVRPEEHAEAVRIRASLAGIAG